MSNDYSDRMNDIQAIHRIIDLYNRLDDQKSLKAFIESIMHVFPADAVSLDTVCYAYYKAKDYPKAIAFGERALGAASANESLAIRYNLGKCYLNGNMPIKARNAFALVAQQDTSKVDIKLDLAAALYACNQKDEAYKLLLELDKDTTIDPKNALAVDFNLGTHYIREGDFKKGMEYLSIGRKLRIWGSYTHKFPIPEWQGEAVEGKHILIVGEGGIGDELINARFVHHIRALGMKASFASCQNLASVLKRMPFEQTLNYRKFTTDIPNIAEFDYWTPAMNLPKTLGVDIDGLWHGPYISSDSTYNTKWADRLKGDFKVGLRWSGNPLYEQDLHRSIPLEKINALLPTDWTKYSIQKENTDVLTNFPDIIDLENELETFEDAIACINNLDLVITSCTSVAHAASALGKKVVIMVPIMDYYVWGEGKSKSSWYGDNVTLIRQDTPGSWDSAISKLKEYIDGVKITNTTSTNSN